MTPFPPERLHRKPIAPILPLPRVPPSPSLRLGEGRLKPVGIKQLCRKAGVAKVEAGPKGIVLGFRNDSFARPERLIGFITARPQRMKLRPDHRLVITEPTASPQDRLRRVRGLVEELARLAA